MPERIGKYEILGKLGAGGMAVVYRAMDPLLGRVVAIKLIQQALQEGEEAQKRFFKEARLAASLSHPNIVTVFEMGIEDQLPYIVMEFLPGTDLRALVVKRRPSSLAERVEIALQIAQALQYAHDRGIVHRDIKPENIRIVEDGRVKLMDFGIAKLTGSQTNLTNTGAVLGTISYMSPEQLKGQEVTRSSDIFAFGVVLYELLTFQHPFIGAHSGATVYRILEAVPEALGPGFPDALQWMLVRCLDKSSTNRLQSLETVISRLKSVLVELLGAPSQMQTSAPVSVAASDRPETMVPRQTSEHTEAPGDPENVSGASEASTTKLPAVLQQDTGPPAVELTERIPLSRSVQAADAEDEWASPSEVSDFPAQTLAPGRRKSFAFGLASLLILAGLSGAAGLAWLGAGWLFSPRPGGVPAVVSKLTEPPTEPPIPRVLGPTLRPTLAAVLRATPTAARLQPTATTLPTETPIVLPSEPPAVQLPPEAPTEPIALIPTTVPTRTPKPPATPTRTAPAATPTRTAPAATPTRTPRPTEPRVEPTEALALVDGIRVGPAPPGTRFCIDGQPWDATARGPAWILNQAPAGRRTLRLLHPRLGSTELTFDAVVSAEAQILKIQEGSWKPPRFVVGLGGGAGKPPLLAAIGTSSSPGVVKWQEQKPPRPLQTTADGTFVLEGNVGYQYRLELGDGTTMVIGFQVGESEGAPGEVYYQKSGSSRVIQGCTRPRPSNPCAVPSPYICGNLK